MEMAEGEKTKKQLFLAELDALLKRYQYDLQANLKYTTRGILPTIITVDIPPPLEPAKTEVKKDAKSA